MNFDPKRLNGAYAPPKVNVLGGVQLAGAGGVGVLKFGGPSHGGPILGGLFGGAPKGGGIGGGLFHGSL